MFSCILPLLALPACVAAQTFQGFVPSVSSNLVVEYEGNTSTPYFISPAGVHVPDASIVASPPTVGLSGHLTSTSKYLLLMVDPELQLTPTNISTILHFLYTDLTSAISVSGNFTALLPAPGNISTTAKYIPPTPPTGASHRYTLLLYSQPSNFVFPASYLSKLAYPAALTIQGVAPRINFNVTAFEETAGLGLPIAANYFALGNGPGPILSNATGNGTWLNVDVGLEEAGTATSTGPAKATFTGAARRLTGNRLLTVFGTGLLSIFL